MIMFGKYADFYDSLYQDKDYDGECDAIEEIFDKYSPKKIHSILDLGCGTGNHTFILHKRGYKIVGVDRSSAMLVNARKKLVKLKEKKNISFKLADIRNLRINDKFDAVIMMFAVLGYQLKDKDVADALKTVRKHLKNGGLFIFDVWYGPAVLSQKPSQRTKTVPGPTGQIIREAFSELDMLNHICTVHYKTSYRKGKRLHQKLTEDHPMRYFFLNELKPFLTKSGLELIRFGGFPNWRKEPAEKTWNIFGIARAA